jgi:hypothetical protein
MRSGCNWLRTVPSDRLWYQQCWNFGLWYQRFIWLVRFSERVREDTRFKYDLAMHEAASRSRILVFFSFFITKTRSVRGTEVGYRPLQELRMLWVFNLFPTWGHIRPFRLAGSCVINKGNLFKMLQSLVYYLWKVHVWFSLCVDWRMFVWSILLDCEVCAFCYEAKIWLG